MRRSSIMGEFPDHQLLIQDDKERAYKEAENGLRQFDEVLRRIRGATSPLILTRETLRDLQFLAVDGVWSSAGHFRNGDVHISHTPHQPPPHQEVLRLVDDMCDYANSANTDPIHVSSYLMWRLNWIHPFFDGNGRTSRAVSYLALSCALGLELPGKRTIPDLIVAKRQPYYEALDAADAAWKMGKVDVSVMQNLMLGLFTEQVSNT